MQQHNPPLFLHIRNEDCGSARFCWRDTRERTEITFFSFIWNAVGFKTTFRSYIIDLTRFPVPFFISFATTVRNSGRKTGRKKYSKWSMKIGAIYSCPSRYLNFQFGVGLEGGENRKTSWSVGGGRDSDSDFKLFHFETDRYSPVFGQVRGLELRRPWLCKNDGRRPITSYRRVAFIS